MPCKETFGPYFENIRSLFLHKNDIRIKLLRFLELSFQFNHVVFLSRLLIILKEFNLLFKVLRVSFQTVVAFVTTVFQISFRKCFVIIDLPHV